MERTCLCCDVQVEPGLSVMTQDACLAVVVPLSSERIRSQSILGDISRLLEDVGL